MNLGQVTATWGVAALGTVLLALAILAGSGCANQRDHHSAQTFWDRQARP